MPKSICPLCLQFSDVTRCVNCGEQFCVVDAAFPLHDCVPVSPWSCDGNSNANSDPATLTEEQFHKSCNETAVSVLKEMETMKLIVPLGKMVYDMLFLKTFLTKIAAANISSDVALDWLFQKFRVGIADAIHMTVRYFQLVMHALQLDQQNEGSYFFTFDACMLELLSTHLDILIQYSLDKESTAHVQFLQQMKKHLISLQKKQHNTATCP